MSTNEVSKNGTVSGLRITENGEVGKVELTKEQDGSTLRSLYAAIGCSLVQAVDLTDKIDMWIDEEGGFSSGVNEVATFVADHIVRKQGNALIQPIFGTVVLLGIDQKTGETLHLNGISGLTGTQLADLQEAARQL